MYAQDIVDILIYLFFHSIKDLDQGKQNGSVHKFNPWFTEE